MNIVLSVNGGMGKCIFATAVCKAIKRKYPNSRLIVISGYSDVFLNVPYVDMAFTHGHELYFYEKYIQNQDVIVFANEPYLVSEHIQQKEHIIESWCRLCDVPYNGEQPEVYLTERELQFFSNKYYSDKPIMVIQTNGGGQQDLKYSWARDMPQFVVKSIIQEYASQYKIFHIRREDQFGYENTIPVHESYKGIAVLLANSQKRLLIDSFCQHLAAALHKKSTVLWIANSHKVFGYDIHDNILSNPETKKPDLRNALFGKYNIGGALHEFPYQTETEIFNIDKVLSSLQNQ
jgi:hypothetical protein